MQSKYVAAYKKKNPKVNTQFVGVSYNNKHIQTLLQHPAAASLGIDTTKLKYARFNQFSVDSETPNILKAIASPVDLSQIHKDMKEEKKLINDLQYYKKKSHFCVFFDINFFHEFLTTLYKDSSFWQSGESSDPDSFVLFNSQIERLSWREFQAFLNDFCSHPTAVPGQDLAPTDHQIEVLWRYLQATHDDGTSKGYGGSIMYDIVGPLVRPALEDAIVINAPEEEEDDEKIDDGLEGDENEGDEDEGDEWVSEKEEEEDGDETEAREEDATKEIDSSAESTKEANNSVESDGEETASSSKSKKRKQSKEDSTSKLPGM